MWWFFHITALFWKIRFPFHSQSFDKSGKSKYLHVACVVLGVIIPLIPVIALMADFAMEVQSNMELQFLNVTFISGGLGFTLGRFPPILCVGYNGSVVFYSSVLSIILILAIGIPELIAIFFTLNNMVRLSRLNTIL